MKILEFIIALIFLSLLLSLFISSMVEVYANKMNRKGLLLQKMISKILGRSDQDKWVDKFYSHPMVSTLSFEKKRLSSYIPANIFSLVLTNIIIKEGKVGNSVDSEKLKSIDNKDVNFIQITDIENGIKKMQDCDIKRISELFLENSQQDPKLFIKSLEDWYSEYMIRVNHAYKRLIKAPMWVLAIIIAIAFNLDAFRVASNLWQDSKMQSDIANAAELFIEKDKDSIITTKAFFEDYKNSFNLPIGWEYELNYYDKESNQNEFWIVRYLFLKVFGLFLTAMIASMGAPFWYDALQKIIGLKKALMIKEK